MTQASPDTPSVVERTRRCPAGAAVVAVHFLGESAAFVLGEEALLLVRDGESAHIPIHGGAILASAGDGERVVTGGDDGKVMATDAAGVSSSVAADARHRWIDQVAIGPSSAVAWSAGKQAFVRSAKGAEHAFEAPSTVGALVFAPKGFRLAVAHYNGATLWFPNAAGAEPETLAWKGSPLAATFSPDARFLVPAMQRRPCTAGAWPTTRTCGCKAWRGCSSIGATTASGWFGSGATHRPVAASVKTGPMGKTRRCWRRTSSREVACHDQAVAVGYAMALFDVRLPDGASLGAQAGRCGDRTVLEPDGCPHWDRGRELVSSTLHD